MASASVNFARAGFFVKSSLRAVAFTAWAGHGYSGNSMKIVSGNGVA